MLYTRKGDNGTTKKFDCDQRFSKSAPIAEALGALDEVNSYIGVCKVESAEVGLKAQGKAMREILHDAQENLFMIQAEVAGAKKTIGKEKIEAMEVVIDGIEKELPPIKTFFISGGTKLAANLDFARTLARRAERRAVAVSEEGKAAVGEFTLAYLNRLSTLMYALARLSNHLSGINEEPPRYN